MVSPKDKRLPTDIKAILLSPRAGQDTPLGPWPNLELYAFTKLRPEVAAVSALGRPHGLPFTVASLLGLWAVILFLKLCIILTLFLFLEFSLSLNPCDEQTYVGF